MNPVSGADRRLFLRMLATTPFAAAAAWAQQPALPAGRLSSPDQAISVMDFEAAAQGILPPAHWGYMASGVDDDLTIKANREGFTHFRLRPRRLVDVSSVDMTTEVFGTKWAMPLFLSPIGGQKMFHSAGEIAVARAAREKKVVQILSTATSVSVEDVAAALGTPPWYQLYMPVQWAAAEQLVKRVEAVGCPVLVWTVDLLGGRNLETAERYRRLDTRQCTACHTSPRGGRSVAELPMFSGLTGGMNPSAATWEYVDRLKKLTRMKVVLKGLDTREDARLAREHGADGIIVSNHGGRATETGRATIDAVGEVIDGVGGQIPVFVDGGFRRGTDIFKALALGAKAVGVGRPYVWALSAFGQPGVERVIDILHDELQLTMRECGTPRIADITRASISA